MESKKQILFMRGGESFGSRADYLEFLRTVPVDPYLQRKKWRDWLAEKLEGSYEMLVPSMPCQENADYESWKIWFERHLPFLHDPKPVLIGNSLGGTFLLKWLSENTFPKRISQLHLVAAWTIDDLSLSKMSTFAFDAAKISTISGKCDEVHVWQSKDDTVVPFENAELIMKHLPDASLHVFDDRQHFNQPEFPEMLQVIQS